MCKFKAGDTVQLNLRGICRLMFVQDDEVCGVSVLEWIKLLWEHKFTIKSLLSHPNSCIASKPNSGLWIFPLKYLKLVKLKKYHSNSLGDFPKRFYQSNSGDTTENYLK